MRTILIPVDFSEGSVNSCRYAFDFLAKEKAIVHLFHIYNDQVMTPASGFPGGGLDTTVTFFNSDLILALKEQAEKEMEAMKQELNNLIKKKKYNIQLRDTLVGGDPRWEITETIQELHPDLVIMSTQGKGRKGFLEGRIAEKIMNKSSVPVLAVSEDFNDFSMKSILYTTNFNPLDVNALKFVLKMIEGRNATIHVCHLMKEKESENAAMMMKTLENDLGKVHKGVKINFYQIQTENESDALNTFAHEHQIDLVSFLPGKKHLIKDFFSLHKLHKKDLFRLELPLLAVHI